VRVRALHPDVLLLTSAIWQSNCVVVRCESEAFLIDSPILPEELQALPSLLAQAGFPTPNGVLATHGDWDHLLGRLAFPEAPLGAAPATVARLRSRPGEPQRELRAFDKSFYLEREHPLGLGSLQELPVPGRLEVGARELELHAAEGHTRDGMSISIGWARVLVAGDYLSSVELPVLGAGASVDAYLATLGDLRKLAQSAAHVVPGHGPVLDAECALELLEQDVQYLSALVGGDAELPAGRRARTQRALHEQNLSLLAGQASSEGT
jgi:glyoxylase-like metal-dependent hydrolase (beta-lactamase superfamily II)